MKTGSEIIYNSTVKNPFAQSQARNYSDETIVKDFQTTSLFWTLFNEQHEILIGTRGSGKTILLKMMRYSYLRRLRNKKAKMLVTEKKYIAIYAPTNMEFMGCFDTKQIPDELRINYFQFSFNCLLACAFLKEVMALLEDKYPDIEQRAEKSRSLANQLQRLWFPETGHDLIFLNDLFFEIQVLYENSDITKSSFDETVPATFRRGIGNPIKTAGKIVSDAIELKSEPKWILCIDEAEFLKEPYQRCFNTIMRSDSGNVVFKLATLPFHYCTKETEIDGTYCEAHGNDFNFRIIDMDYNTKDFADVTNGICRRRMRSVFKNAANINSLKDFLGTVGKEHLIDYYNLEFDSELGIPDIRSKMTAQLGVQRKAKTVAEGVKRKPIYDRFAPLFYLREFYKKSKKGNTKVGWYAGETMVRKLSQGNPRRYIQLMHALFEMARTRKLRPSIQHEVLFEQAELMTKSAYGIPLYGPELQKVLVTVAEKLKARTHNGDLIETGNSFKLTPDNADQFEVIEALKIGVAYSYVIVDEQTIIHGITRDTRFALSNIVCAKYWVPMRYSGQPSILVAEEMDEQEDSLQMNLFWDGKRQDVTES